jgi:hypothetical protein
LLCGAPTNRPDRRRLDARGRYEPVTGRSSRLKVVTSPPRLHCCENHHTPDKPGPTQNQQSHRPITTQRLDTRTTVELALHLSCAETRHSCGGLVFRWYPPSAPDHGARVLLTWEGHLSVGRYALVGLDRHYTDAAGQALTQAGVTLDNRRRTLNKLRLSRKNATPAFPHPRSPRRNVEPYQ